MASNLFTESALRPCLHLLLRCVFLLIRSQVDHAKYRWKRGRKLWVCPLSTTSWGGRRCIRLDLFTLAFASFLNIMRLFVEACYPDRIYTLLSEIVKQKLKNQNGVLLVLIDFWLFPLSSFEFILILMYIIYIFPSKNWGKWIESGWKRQIKAPDVNGTLSPSSNSDLISNNAF